ncbi:hypothetical protein GGS20DRAFT_576144 [Poronia punctata]|nr:hypothetical protein GGS20DRAFT_576144 [Poronia punctata]
MSFGEAQYTIHHASYGLQYMYGYPPQRAPMMTDRGAICDGKTESKPRLSKDEVEKLEKVFQENPKPSSSVKAQLADGLGLERPRINNWFQNRRAKAKQERKQEEYEALRAAEKSASAPSSPDEDSSSTGTDSSSETCQKRTQPSSAAFPDVSSQISNSVHDEDEEEDDDEEEEDCENERERDNPVKVESSVSPREVLGTYHSPLLNDYAQPEAAGFMQDHGSVGFMPSRSMSDFGLYPLAHDSAMMQDRRASNGQIGLAASSERSLSSQGYSSSHHYTTVPNTSSGTAFFSPISSNDSCDMSEGAYESTASPECHSDPASMVVSPGGVSADSFRSPPPPSNIASRRKITGPAELDMNAATCRSRSYNMAKTTMDGSKRMVSSPVSSMRRISTATGAGAGRIQKSSSGPRSPMFFGRNAEALLQQYHSRSPVGSGTPSYQGAAPPTPMTPALFDQRSLQEPAVITGSPDDGSFDLVAGATHGYMSSLKEDNDIKTPPTTPGMMAEYDGSGFVNNAFNTGFHINTDQPLMTPYFHSEFPDMSVQNVPNYIDSNEGVTPTPVYGGMMSSGMEHSPVTGNVMGNNTQYDWDANEAVVSSRSSPSNSKSRQIQFTPNITPQDYH